MIESRTGGDVNRTHIFTLTPTPTAVGVARRQLARFCQRHNLGEVADTAALLVSELVTNAIVHGRGEVTLSMAQGSGALLVAVHDESAERPRLRSPSPDQAEGRGLLLVDALATSWECKHHPHEGKTVSFTLAQSAV